MAGHIGNTSAHVDSRPCKPGEVDPVSMDLEWDEDIILIDLELLGGQGESRGKLGRHTPSATIRVFQRALIQWGCESASPGRNPLPSSGANGKYGDEFRRGVRQFQREAGLSVDGTAGPRTVKAMARELYGINLRQEVEREVERDRANEKLELQQTADDEFDAREERIQLFIDVLYENGDRFRNKRGGDQYKINAAAMVAERIDGFGAEIISEGLERVQLGNPAFYEHVLFGGRLISALQDRGVYGVTFKAPSDVDFLIGFIIEANDLEHNSPLASPQFSGWDHAKIFAGFVFGVPEGIKAGFVDNVESIKALADPDFWSAMYDMVPRIIDEPNFRFDIGRASAEALHAQLTELNASSPYDYGNKLGVLFGMLVFEFAATFFTGGVAVALKGLKGAKLLSKFPRMQRLCKRIASSSLIRAGAVLASKLSESATAIIQRVDELVARVRKLLPDLTNDAKIASKVDEFTDADMIESLATKKELTRKLEQLELEQEKLELALSQAEPDFDQVQRYANNVEQKADEIEDLIARKKLDEPDEAPEVEDYVDVPDGPEPDGHGAGKGKGKHKDEDKHEDEGAAKNKDGDADKGKHGNADSDTDGHHDPDHGKDNNGDPYDDREKPKDNDKDNDNALRLVAKRAEQAAWMRAKSHAARKVILEADMRRVIAGTKVKRGRGIRVQLRIERQGTHKWRVKASASKGTRRAIEHSVYGWLGHDETRGRWLTTAHDQEKVHARVVANSKRRIEAQIKEIVQDEPEPRKIAKLAEPAIRKIETDPQPKLLGGVHFNVQEENPREQIDSARRTETLRYRYKLGPNVESGNIDAVDVNLRMPNTPTRSLQHYLLRMAHPRISNLGVYKLDPNDTFRVAGKEPRFIVDPPASYNGNRGRNDRWNACLTSTEFEPERYGWDDARNRLVRRDTVNEGMRTTRIDEMKSHVVQPAVRPMAPAPHGVVDAILSHDDGRSPRRLGDIHQEDAYDPATHFLSHHVLGSGTGGAETRRELAIRAIHLMVPASGGGWNPTTPTSVSSAWTSANVANQVLEKLQNSIDRRWTTYRDEIVQAHLTNPQYQTTTLKLSGTGFDRIAYKRVGAAWPGPAKLPAYLYPSGMGVRPLFAADLRSREWNTWTRSPGSLTPDPTPKTSRYYGQNHVTVRIKQSAAHSGWIINTMFPDT